MSSIWLTDIHLEFVAQDRFSDFIRELANTRADEILISGDIADSRILEDSLVSLWKHIRIPIFFVLGNHDYYHGSISRVRTAIEALTDEVEELHWLCNCEAIRLNSSTTLVGHDGWGDSRLGDFENTTVTLNDFVLISELELSSRAALRCKLMALGDEAAEHFRQVLPIALERSDHVVVLTHVPPFREASWFEGRFSNDEWLPFFACKAVGDVLLDTMRNCPDKKMTVLCGHTHGGGVSEILPNLTSYTGEASYGQPQIQRLFEWQ